jgi:hypothetical protein
MNDNRKILFELVNLSTHRLPVHRCVRLRDLIKPDRNLKDLCGEAIYLEQRAASRTEELCEMKNQSTELRALEVALPFPGEGYGNGETKIAILHIE